MLQITAVDDTLVVLSGAGLANIFFPFFFIIVFPPSINLSSSPHLSSCTSFWLALTNHGGGLLLKSARCIVFSLLGHLDCQLLDLVGDDGLAGLDGLPVELHRAGAAVALLAVVCNFYARITGHILQVLVGVGLDLVPAWHKGDLYRVGFVAQTSILLRRQIRVILKAFFDRVKEAHVQGRLRDARLALHCSKSLGGN